MVPISRVYRLLLRGAKKRFLCIKIIGKRPKPPFRTFPSHPNQKTFLGKKLFWGHEGKTFPIFWVGGATRKKPHVTLQLFFRPTWTLQSFFGLLLRFLRFLQFLLFQAEKINNFLVFPCRWCRAGRAGATQVARRPRRCHARRFHAGSTQVPRRPRRPRMFNARRFHASHAGSAQATQVPRRPRKSRRFHAISLKFKGEIVTNWTYYRCTLSSKCAFVL